MTLPRSHQPNPETTPLHRAAEAGDVRTVEQMLSQGYGPNIPDRDGKTPLHLASNIEVAQLLIERGGDVNAVNHGGYRALHSASRRGYAKLVELLLEHGAAVNATAGHYRLTPLHLAADSSHEAVVRCLLNHGADPRAADWIGMTPVDVARERDNERILKLLQPDHTPTNTPRKHPGMMMIG